MLYPAEAKNYSARQSEDRVEPVPLSAGFNIKVKPVDNKGCQAKLYIPQDKGIQLQVALEGELIPSSQPTAEAVQVRALKSLLQVIQLTEMDNRSSPVLKKAFSDGAHLSGN